MTTFLRDLMQRNHGTLTNMDPSTDWVGSNRPGGWGAFDVYSQLKCDSCGRRIEGKVDLSLLATEGVQRSVAVMARGLGWAVIKRYGVPDSHQCPNCVEREKTDA